MLSVTVTSPAIADDEEVAAAIAAVCLYSRAVEPAEVDSSQTVSAWKVASVLEGTGRISRLTTPPIEEVRKNAWKATQLAKLFSLLVPLTLTISYFNGSAVRAQPAPAPAPPLNAVADNPIGAPPLAPPINAPQFNRQDLGIRVGLALDVTSAEISLPDGAVLRDGTTGTTLADLPPQSRWQLTLRSPAGNSRYDFLGKLNNVARSQVMLASRSVYRNVAFAPGVAPPNIELAPMPATRQPQFSLPAQLANDTGSLDDRSYVLVPPADGTIAVNGKLYRGSLMVRTKSKVASSSQPAGGTDSGQALASRTSPLSPGGAGGNPVFSLINYVDLEDYLLSVVPSEMPSGWPLEALKAQAIAARSYAMARVGGHESDGYDVKPTIADQVYTGVAAESANSNRAVNETAGQVIKYGGNVVTAYFHSASGGYTEVSENVWSRPVPYLRAVPDYDDESPHFSWNRTFSVTDAEQALNKNGKSVGKLLALMPVARGVSPRVRWLMAVGTDRTAFISGEIARKAFSLPSSSFNVVGTDGKYMFAGRGFGHGLGMSQWGAKKLAEAGYTSGQILTYYYKDISVERF